MNTFWKRAIVWVVLFGCFSGVSGSINLNVAPGILNTVTIETAPASTISYFASETNGPIIANQIDLHYSADFDIVSVQTPTGWTFQNILASATEKIATYYFTGIDAGNPNELYNFGEPLALRFNTLALSTQSPTAEITLLASLTGLDSNDAIFSVVLNETFAANVIPEPSQSLLLGLLVMAGVVYGRRR